MLLKEQEEFEGITRTGLKTLYVFTNFVHFIECSEESQYVEES
jgi:hypothetical protein